MGLVEKSRQDRLGPDELSGGTFTITNLGGYGVDAFTPIVNPTGDGDPGRRADRPQAGPWSTTSSPSAN